jgi:hypothetical protein
MSEAKVEGETLSTRSTVDTPGYSLRAYARHRGCSPEAVSKAIKSQRLHDAVQWFAGVPRIMDFRRADREWQANTDQTRKPLAWHLEELQGCRRCRGRMVFREPPHDDDPVPIERLTVVDGVGDGLAFVSANGKGDNPWLDECFTVDAPAARWLAGELLRCADQLESSAAAVQNEEASR